jgi:hypothetical protein
MPRENLSKTTCGKILFTSDFDVDSYLVLDTLGKFVEGESFELANKLVSM